MEGKILELSRLVTEIIMKIKEISNYQQSKFLYFSYGMNTLQDNMDFPNAHCEYIGPCILPGWRLEFRRFCDIDRDPGSEVVGVLWSIDKSALGHLDHREGYPEHYSRSKVNVIHNNKQDNALVYYMTERYKEHLQLPSNEYLRDVVDGYKESKLPLTQIVQAFNRAKSK